MQELKREIKCQFFAFILDGINLTDEEIEKATERCLKNKMSHGFTSVEGTQVIVNCEIRKMDDDISEYNFYFTFNPVVFGKTFNCKYYSGEENICTHPERKISDEIKHVCGASGFGMSSSDICAYCEEEKLNKSSKPKCNIEKCPALSKLK